MATSLQNQFIDQSYQKLVQIEGNAIADGTGSAISELDINVTSANSALTATTASYALYAVSASHEIIKEVSASYADFAEVAGVANSVEYSNVENIPAGIVSSSTQIGALGFVNSDVTASLVETASANLNVVTFTKGDGSTFNITVDTGSASVEDWDTLQGKPAGLVSGSQQVTDLGFVKSDVTASSFVDASAVETTITFVKGDGSTQELVLTAPPAVSASYAVSSSHAINSDFSLLANVAALANQVSYVNITDKPTLISGSSQVTISQTTGQLDSSRIDGTVASSVSASHAVSADSSLASNTSISSSHSLTANTSISSSHALNADNAIAAQTAITASYALNVDDPTWDEIQNKPVGLVSGSSQITLADATGNLDGARITGTVANATDAVNATNATNAVSSSHAVIADTALTANTATSAGSASTAVSASHAIISDTALASNTSISASHAVQADSALTADLATLATNATNAVSSSHSLNADNAIDATNALTASKVTDTDIAYKNQNNTFTGLQTFDSITATSASFSHVQTVTGSAVIVGEQYIILNADSPTARFAGLQVYDSGSLTTGSLEWDSVDDNWIQVKTNGQSGGILTGVHGAKGSEVYPTNNRLTKGTGTESIQDSSITDSGTLVTVNNPLTVTGQISGNVTGTLTGNASSATTASHALTSNTALVADLATNATNADNATSASYALTATSADNATTAISASHALIADQALTSQTATSASFATNSQFAANALVADSATTAVSASHALNADSALIASNASNLNGEAGSYYTNAGNLSSGTVQTARLTGTYDIDISGNAATATTAGNSTQLGGVASSNYARTDISETFTQNVDVDGTITSTGIINANGGIDVNSNLNYRNTIGDSILLSSGTQTVSLNTGDFFRVGPNGDMTINLANVDAGQSKNILIDNTPGHTISWDSRIKWPGGTAPSLTGVSIVTLVSFVDGTFYGTSVESLS